MHAPHRALALPVLLVPIAAQEPAPPTDQSMAALRAELAAARAEIDALRALGEQRPAVVHGSFGIDVTTAYYFRGILQEDAGVIAQPTHGLGWTLLGGEGPVRDVALEFGTWNSAHSGNTGGSGGVWYESDVYATLSGTFFERWSLATTYSVYHSPNGSFTTVEEQSVEIAFDDSGWLWDGGVMPSLLVAFELDGQADGGNGLGHYVELGLDPYVALGSLGESAFTLTVPVHVGWGLRDFYELPGTGDTAFGFVDLGVVLSCNLPCAPENLGPWDLSVGLHWLLLGSTNEARNSGDADEWIGTIGLRTTF